MCGISTALFVRQQGIGRTNWFLVRPFAQAEREAAAAHARETLEGLWSALDVAADDIDRQIFQRLLTGPARLHAQSLAKVLY